MGNFYRNGRKWSSEAFRLSASKALSGTDENQLATQQGWGSGTDPVTLVSDSVEDDPAKDASPATKRSLVLTVTGGDIQPGDVLDLGVDANHYTYTMTGLESGPGDVVAALVISAAADPIFDVTTNGTDLDLLAKIAGTAANAVTVTWAWTTGTGTVNTANTNGADIAAGVAGTGCFTVKVEYLDAEGKSASETVTLNGTAPAYTSANARWVQRITVASAGSNGKAVGNVTCAIDGTAQVAIHAASLQSDSLGYVVPFGKQLRITSLLATASNAIRVRVYSNYDPETGITFAEPNFGLLDFYTTGIPEAVDLPYGIGAFPASSVIFVTAQGTDGVIVAVGLNAFLEPEGAN